MNSMLSRVRAAAQTMATSPQPATARTAIIDIGSNSVRLVVYDGPRRLPFILFNEKVMAGLGASLARTGRIEEEPMERGLRAIGRFAHLCQDMKVAHIRCVATAAVRDATNGDEFIDCDSTSVFESTEGNSNTQITLLPISLEAVYRIDVLHRDYA